MGVRTAGRKLDRAAGRGWGQGEQVPGLSINPIHQELKPAAAGGARDRAGVASDAGEQVGGRGSNAGTAGRPGQPVSTELQV